MTVVSSLLIFEVAAPFPVQIDRNHSRHEVEVLLSKLRYILNRQVSMNTDNNSGIPIANDNSKWQLHSATTCKPRSHNALCCLPRNISTTLMNLGWNLSWKCTTPLRWSHRKCPLTFLPVNLAFSWGPPCTNRLFKTFSVSSFSLQLHPPSGFQPWLESCHQALARDRILLSPRLICQWAS